jgi:hypothetical protein
MSVSVPYHAYPISFIVGFSLPTVVWIKLYSSEFSYTFYYSVTLDRIFAIFSAVLTFKAFGIICIFSDLIAVNQLSILFSLPDKTSY